MGRTANTSCRRRSESVFVALDASGAVVTCAAAGIGTGAVLGSPLAVRMLAAVRAAHSARYFVSAGETTSGAWPSSWLRSGAAAGLAAPITRLAGMGVPGAIPADHAIGCPRSFRLTYTPTPGGTSRPFATAIRAVPTASLVYSPHRSHTADHTSVTLCGTPPLANSTFSTRTVNGSTLITLPHQSVTRLAYSPTGLPGPRGSQPNVG